MADVIAAGIVGSLAIIGVAGWWGARQWWHIRAAARETNEAVRLVQAGQMAALTSGQRQLARSYYLGRYVAHGHAADKQHLEDLQVLEEE